MRISAVGRTITIQTLTLDGKKLTKAVIHQLPSTSQPIISYDKGVITSHGLVWGYIRAKFDGDRWDPEFWYLIELGEKLYRVNRIIMNTGVIYPAITGSPEEQRVGLSEENRLSKIEAEIEKELMEHLRSTQEGMTTQLFY